MGKKYHEEHPTISFRCRSIDEYNKIKKMVEYSGKSESTFIREILLGAEQKESQSYNSGYAKAFNKFALGCSICGKDMIFDLINDREHAEKILKLFGHYAHENCIEEWKKQREAELERRANAWFGW